LHTGWWRFLAAFLLCSCLHQPAVAEPADDALWVQQIEALGAKSLAARQQALSAIVESADPRLQLLLEALQEGRVLTQGDRVVIVDSDGHVLDLLTLVATDETASGRKLTVNNQMRVLIGEGLALARLRHGEARDRLRALATMLEHPPDEAPQGLRRMLESESDPRVVEALEAVVAMGDLRSEDSTVQLTAISRLAGRMQPAVYNRLLQLAEATDNEEVKAAARKAVADIELRRRLNGAIEMAYFGLGLGAVLALCAIGLAITFGVMGVINMAHGEMMMLGAYATFVVQQSFPNALEYSLLIALPAAFLVAALTGFLIEWLVVSRLYGRPLETLLATFGLSLVLQQAVRSIFGATNRAVSSPAWMSGSFELVEGLELTWGRLYIIVFCLLVFAVLGYVLRATRLGLQIRAVAQHRSMARALGIPSRRVDGLTFALGSGIAGLAGVALSQLTNVGPNLGQAYIVDAFMVVVFGGVGSLWGTLVAGLGLGIFTKLLEPSVGAVLGKVLVLVAIIIFIQRYPRGLFPMKGRSLEP
jgi:urea transport system permease protein